MDEKILEAYEERLKALRRQLAEEEIESAKLRAEAEQLKKDKEVLIEQRDAAYQRQDNTMAEVERLKAKCVVGGMPLPGLICVPEPAVIKLINGWVEQDAVHCEQCGGGPCKGTERKTFGAGEPCPRCTYQMPVGGPCTKCGYVVKAKPESRYGWSEDPETDRALQAKYGDSVHRPKAERQTLAPAPEKTEDGSRGAVMQTICAWCDRKPVTPPFAICADCLDATRPPDGNACTGMGDPKPEPTELTGPRDEILNELTQEAQKLGMYDVAGCFCKTLNAGPGGTCDWCVRALTVQVDLMRPVVNAAVKMLEAERRLSATSSPEIGEAEAIQAAVARDAKCAEFECAVKAYEKSMKAGGHPIPPNLCQVDVPIQGGDTRRCWNPLPCAAHPCPHPNPTGFVGPCRACGDE